MSVRDVSIDPLLLKSAREEFLEKGYLDSSVHEICRRAGVTTGALYKRYKSKADLFSAVVSDAVELLNDISRKALEQDTAGMSDEELLAPFFSVEKCMLEWFRFLESVRDEFTILMRGSAGCAYSNFRHELAVKMMENDYRYLQEAQRRGLARQDVDKKEFHVIISSYWELFCEPFAHEMTWEEMKHHWEIASKMIDWPRAMKIRRVRRCRERQSGK